MLGLIDDARHELGQATLEAGDVLALVTDGVTEAFSEQEVEMGDTPVFETLAAAREQGAEGILDALVAAVHQWTGAAGCSDDLTALVLKALERDPKDRYGNAAEFAGRLKEARRRLAVLVTPQTVGQLLSGAFALESFNSSDFFEAASRTFIVGPVVRWPIFAGGRIRAGIEAADARQEQALVEYEKSILAALEEVENTLVGYLREGERRRSILAAADADKRAATLSDDLYKKGLASFLEVLEAQQNLFVTQAELARSEAGVSLALVSLYRALGGGWEAPK